MGFISKLRTYAGVMRQAKRPLDGLRLLRQRPALLVAVNAYELGLLVSDRVEGRLKALGSIKTSALIGCPF